MRHLPCRVRLLLVVLSLHFLSATLCSQRAMAEGASIMELLASMQSPDADTRSQAAIALGRLGEDGADATRGWLPRSPATRSVRASAAWALARIGRPLLQRYRPPHEPCAIAVGRCASGCALGALGSQAASAGFG